MSRCKAITTRGNRCKNDALDGSDFCHIPSHNEEDAKVDRGLSAKRKRFCQLYVSEEFYGNGVQSYMKAYGVDYDTAAVGASRLLKNDKICRYINDLLDEAGLNDQFVDKELLHVITQKVSYQAKMRAIQEYNKLRDRITQRHDITSGGEPVDGLTFEIVDKKEDIDEE